MADTPATQTGTRPVTPRSKSAATKTAKGNRPAPSRKTAKAADTPNATGDTAVVKVERPKVPTFPNCPLCGYEFKKGPKARCADKDACAKRAAARQAVPA